MTIAAVGSLIEADAVSFPLTPAAVGHFILANVANFSGSPVTGLSSGNVTWSVLVPATAVGNYLITRFIGNVTSTTPGTVTVATADASLGIRVDAREFSTSAGYDSLQLADSGILDVTGTAWPSLTARAGDLYFGSEVNDSSATAGATSGYTYAVDSHGNGVAYSVRSAAGATSPAWGDSHLRDAVAVLIREAPATTVATRDQSGGGTVAPAGTAVTLTWGSAPAAGAKVLVAVWSDVAVASVRDNGSTRTTFISDRDNGGSQGYAYIFRGDEITLPASGSYRVTVTFRGTPSALFAAGYSYTQVASGPPASAGQATGTSRTPSSGTVTPLAPGSLVFGFFIDDSAAAETIAVTTPGASGVYSSGSSAGIIGGAADLVAASANPQSIAWSVSGAAPGWGGLAVAYAPRSSGTPVPAASGTGSAGQLYPAAVIPAATGTGSTILSAVPVPVARGTGRAGSVTPPPGSELSPGYPAGRLDDMLELFLGTQWVPVPGERLVKSGNPEASIRSGQPDGGQQPVPASMPVTFDNYDGTFSARNENGPYFGLLKQNTPARHSVASPYGTYLRLEAGTSGGATAPDSPALHVAGDMELRILLRLSDYRGCVLMARDDSGNPSWSWVLDDDGRLRFTWWDSGGGYRYFASYERLPVLPGAAALRMTFTASTSTVAFYTGTSLDGEWAGLGDSGTFATASTIRAGDSALEVGYSGSAAEPSARGHLYAFRVLDGIGGTVVAEGDFSQLAPGAPAWQDSAGNSWTVAGDGEVTARDYVLHGELSVLNPVAPRMAARMKATVSGRMRRLQQGSQPAADSPMKRGILSQKGDLYPVAYWTMEESGNSGAFGPAVGSSGMEYVVRGSPGTDSSFEASAPLPQLGDAGGPYGPVPAYDGATAWSVRFLLKLGSTLPSDPGFSNIVRVFATGGAVAQLDVDVDHDSNVRLTGLDAGAAQVFQTTWIAWPQMQDGVYAAVECVPVSGSQVQYNFVTIEPGVSTGQQVGLGLLPAVTGTFGSVSAVQFNSVSPPLKDTVVGHVTVQKAWTSLFDLGSQLNAYRGELAALRFARVCRENSIPCRILGVPALTAALGPQPRGSAWAILKDTVWADQGLLFEPQDVPGVGFRTRASMTGQQPAVTLDFGSLNLPGDLSPSDDDVGLVNDVTGSDASGTTWREVLDDGSPRSVAEPQDGGAGRYVSQPPAAFNVADPAQLQETVQWYLKVRAVDEQRYRQVTANCGIPGAPVEDIARVRPGDLVVIRMPPPSSAVRDTEGNALLDTEGSFILDGSAILPDAGDFYQSADIRQLVTGQTLALGPGRAPTWDCQPASPYDVSVGGGTGGGSGQEGIPGTGSASLSGIFATGTGVTTGPVAQYTQTLIDDFSSGSLDSGKWRTPLGTDGISVTGGKLVIEALTGDEQVVALRTDGHDLSTGIFGMQLWQSGTSASGTMWHLSFNDDPEDLANYYEWQTYPIRQQWYSWADGAGASTSGDQGAQNILALSVWNNGDWLGIGDWNKDGNNRVHVYKSSDGITWTEIASFEVTGAVDESDVYFYFGTNYDPGTGTANYVATVDNVSWFERNAVGGGGGGGTPPPATGALQPPLLGSYDGDTFHGAPSAWPSGAQTNIAAMYIAWDTSPSDVATFLASCKARGISPFLELEPWHFDQSAVSYSSITSGGSDSFLQAIGQAIASAGIDAAITVGHEFNVSGQYPWSQNASATLGYGSGPGGGDLSPSQWVAGWVYMRAKVNQYAGGHAKWMWACSAFTGGTTVSPAPWWPGAGQVDMVGVDGYPTTEWGASLGTFNGQLKPTSDIIRGLGWSDWIFLAETNLEQMVASGGQDITSFVADMFANHWSGMLQFQDPLWGLPPMSAAHWSQYHAAVAQHYGS